MGPNTLRRAHAALPVSAVQNEYSMLWRGPEEVIIPLCRELGIGFVPWSPLGVQFLTGWIDENTRFATGDIRGMEPRFSPGNMSGKSRVQAERRRLLSQPVIRPVAFYFHGRIEEVL
jgi:aryl-alcohol dehydrogenase-like predicted oxidoreductase